MVDGGAADGMIRTFPQFQRARWEGLMRKRLLTLLIVGFVLWFIFTQPVEAADLVRSGFDTAGRLLSGAASALSTFLNNLV
jgi:hypothetical protein